VGASKREELFLPYNDSRGSSMPRSQRILNVELTGPDHLYWPDLDVDLTLDSIRNPRSIRSYPGLGLEGLKPNEFRCHINNYSQSAIFFRRSRPDRHKGNEQVHAEARTVPRIHLLLHETEWSPTGRGGHAEVFQDTPPTVHAMVLKLEQLGLIERVPYQPEA